MRFSPFALLILSFLALAIPLSASEDKTITSRIRRTPVNSSAVASVGYSKRQHALEIEFRNGAVYCYFDVPVKNYHELMAASSKASYYDINIRHHFRSVHVKPRP